MSDDSTVQVLEVVGAVVLLIGVGAPAVVADTVGVDLVPGPDKTIAAVLAVFLGPAVLDELVGGDDR